MDRAACGTIDVDLRKAIEEIAEKFSLNVELGGGRFDPYSGEYTPKITFQLVTADGVPASFVSNLWRYNGLTSEHYNAEFRGTGGVMFRLIGVKPSRHKYPMSVERLSDGAQFKMTYAQVSRFFGIKEVA